MPRLTWTPGALADVQRLHRFLASKDADAAQRAVKAIREGVKILALHPRIGRPAQNMAAEFRQWSVGFGASGYVISYRVDDDNVTLLAVWHQREAGYQ